MHFLKPSKQMPLLRNCKFEVCSENNGNLRFFEKNIYLFVYIFFVAFKIVPIRYYARVPALLPILKTLLKLDLSDSL